MTRWIKEGRNPGRKRGEGTSKKIPGADIDSYGPSTAKWVESTVGGAAMHECQDSYFDRRGAAAYLKVSPRTLDRLREDGKIRTYFPTPDRPTFKRADLDKYVAGTAK
jgi:excisionase family DNA binding protein